MKKQKIFQRNGNSNNKKSLAKINKYDFKNKIKLIFVKMLATGNQMSRVQLL